MSSRINALVASFIKEGFISVEDYAKRKISYEYCIAASHKRFHPEITPYLLPVFRAWDFTGVKKEITVMAPAQTAKSTCWQIPLLHSFEYKKTQSIIVYPSEIKAQNINDTRLFPLMKAIPTLAEELKRPHSRNLNSIKLSENTSFFLGAGARVTSYPSQINIADEVDEWNETEEQVSNVDELRDRATSFNESMLCKVCTPTTTNGKIWKEFEKSSMGYWTLRCLKCGQLTMPSHDVDHILKFSFDLVNNKKVLRPGSPVYIECQDPECKHKHYEADRHQMNLKGDYVHLHPELINSNIGFQWGALARPDLSQFSLENIAKEKLKSGKTGSKNDRMNFYRKYCGMPFNAKVEDNIDCPEEVKKHIAEKLPDASTLEAIFVTVDTQFKFWKYQIVGLDIHSNRYVLGYGSTDFLELEEEKRAELNRYREKEAVAKGVPYSPIVTIEDVLYQDYHGLEPLLAIIDEGGFNKDKVKNFVLKHEKLFAYKGYSAISRPWKFSEDKINQPKLILAKPHEYQAEFIYYLYNQNNTENYFWFLKPNTDINYLKEITAVRATEKTNGKEPENWEHEGRIHDFFDLSKMYFTLEDVAITELDTSYFQHGKAEILQSLAQAETEEIEIPVTSTSKSWVNGWN